MAKDQPWKAKGMKKDEWLADEVAKAVGAGKPWACETVEFSDPDRPPTCIEVDFPIIPINEIAAIEGNAGKPIYQMSKWWARRRSSVFRAMLLASAIKAPDDPAEAAKLVWDVYYGNHQKKGAFKHLKVADIFMGGGTTIVEGSRLEDQDTPMTVLEALLGINQLLDEEAGGIKEAPPHNAEPFTRMLLRLFDGKGELARDQMQKFLRGTGSAPSDFADRGWVFEEKKVFHLTPPLDLARAWIGKHRKGMQSDYDQALFLVGACFEGSGINVNETLGNPNFRPHPALGALLTWLKTHGADTPTRNAAAVAASLYQTWASKNQSTVKQLELFDDLGEAA